MSNPAFFFSFVDADFRLAERLVSQIKESYPEALTIAMGDGAAKGSKLDCACWHGERLKKPGTIGQFTQRNFQFVLDMLDSDLSIASVIKLDPDSFLKRPFTRIPDDAWCGEVAQGVFSWGDCSWCKGGGFLISKAAIEQIVDSQLLLHPRYKTLQSFEESGERVYEDCRLGHVANSLGIYPTPWDQVSCGKLRPSDKRNRGRALVHPVKDI